MMQRERERQGLCVHWLGSQEPGFLSFCHSPLVLSLLTSCTHSLPEKVESHNVAYLILKRPV